MVNLTGLRSPCEQTALSQNRAPLSRLRNCVLGWPGNLAEPTSYLWNSPASKGAAWRPQPTVGSQRAQTPVQVLPGSGNTTSQRCWSLWASVSWCENGANTGQRGDLKDGRDFRRPGRSRPHQLEGTECCLGVFLIPSSGAFLRGDDCLPLILDKQHLVILPIKNNNCFELIYRFFWGQCKIYVMRSQDIRRYLAPHSMHNDRPHPGLLDGGQSGGKDPRGDSRGETPGLPYSCLFWSGLDYPPYCAII